MIQWQGTPYLTFSILWAGVEMFCKLCQSHSTAVNCLWFRLFWIYFCAGSSWWSNERHRRNGLTLYHEINPGHFLEWPKATGGWKHHCMVDVRAKLCCMCHICYYLVGHYSRTTLNPYPSVTAPGYGLRESMGFQSVATVHIRKSLNYLKLT